MRGRPSLVGHGAQRQLPSAEFLNLLAERLNLPEFLPKDAGE